MKIFYLSILIVIIGSGLIFPQTDSSYIKTEEIIDQILDEPGEETDDSDLYLQLEELLNNPVDLNSADVFELQKIPFINSLDALRITEHRSKYGNFFSVNELYSVQGIDTSTVSKILPFVSVDTKELISDRDKANANIFSSFIKDVRFRIRNRLIRDLQTEKGFLENDFSGSPEKIYNRIISDAGNNFSAGFLSEKDAGELNIDEFTSFYLQFKNFSPVQNLIIGDYIVQAGQGLALWSPFGFSKSSDAVHPVKKSTGSLKPYRSATENNFFRGAAADFIQSNILLTLFYSDNKFDASIDPLTNQITSTPIDGLHRTETEIKKRKTASETLYGARLNYTFPGVLNTGILFYSSKFSHSFQPDGIFDISGNEFRYYSFYYDFLIDRINLFGEIVYNGTSAATINSFQLNISENFSVISSVRSYPRNYINLHGFGFGERSGRTENEFGIYYGLKLKSPFGKINFYYDQFKFPYATFSIPVPSGGDEILLDYQHRLLKKFITRFRFKYENKDVIYPTAATDEVLKRLKQNYRLELTYEVSKVLRLKGRFELTSFRIAAAGVKEKGLMIYQDIRITPAQNLNFYGRIIFFKTDSFNSAVYEYENDLTGILSNNAMYGEGIRWYAIARYKFLNNFNISFKYAETYKPFEETLGSGNAEIAGNLENRISIQLDIIY